MVRFQTQNTQTQTNTNDNTQTTMKQQEERIDTLLNKHVDGSLLFGRTHKQTQTQTKH